MSGNSSMYHVKYRMYSSDETFNAYATNSNDLFTLCFILDKTDKITRFVVYWEGTSLIESVFGWGKFEKWEKELYTKAERGE